MRKSLPLFLLSLLTFPLWAQSIKNAVVLNATSRIAVVCPGGTFTLSYDVENFRCANTTFTVQLLRPGSNGFVPVESKTFVGLTGNNTTTLTVPGYAEENALWQARVFSTRPSGCSQDPLQATSNTVNLRIRAGSSTANYLLPPYNGSPQSGPLNICTGQQFRLVALPVEAGQNYTWTGLESGFDPLTNVESNARVVQTTARQAGNYTATVTPSFPGVTGCSVTPSSIAINVSGAGAKPTVTATRTTVCQNGQTTLSLTNSCAGTVTWNNGSSDIGSGNSIVVSPTANTSYTAKCTTTGNCGGSQVSDPIQISVTSIVIDMFAVGVTPTYPTSGPRTTDIKNNLSNGDVLSYPSPRMWSALISPNCPGAESVEMSLTGPGLSFSTVENFEPYALFFNQGNTEFYTINDPNRGIGPAYNNGWPTGNYTLTVKPRDQDGSQAGELPKDRTPQGNVLGSKTVNFTITDPSSSGRIGVAELTSTRVQAYPNPATDRLSIDVNAGPRQAISLQLTDLQGRAVYQNSVTSDKETYHEEINLHKQPSGLYLLKVSTGGRTETLKVLKATN